MYVLASRAAGPEGGDLDVGRGLVGLLGLLGEENDAAVIAGLNTDGLFRVVSPMSVWIMSLEESAIRFGVPCRRLGPHTIFN